MSDQGGQMKYPSERVLRKMLPKLGPTVGLELLWREANIDYLIMRAKEYLVYNQPLVSDIDRALELLLLAKLKTQQ